MEDGNVQVFRAMSYIIGYDRVVWEYTINQL
jgi:hypothetical protein